MGGFLNKYLLRAIRECLFPCRELLDATDDDVIALLGSMVEGNVMAEMRQPCQLATVATKPQYTKKLITGAEGDSAKDPKVVLGEADRDNKKKRDKSDSSKKPTSSEPPQKEQRTYGAGGSSTMVVPPRTSFPIPFVWDEHFVFSRGEVRGAVNHLLYSANENSFLKDQSPLGITRLITRRALQIASTTRHVEESFLPVFQKEGLRNEKFFKGLADKEKKALQKSYDDLKLQLKHVEDSYMEAKVEAYQAKIDVAKALRELEETKAKLRKSESDLKILNEKYENVVMKLIKEACANTIEQLKILNPNLVVVGSDPRAYVINGVIMEDSPNSPIPFVPRDEVMGDSDHALDQGLGKKVEDQVPSSTQQPSSKEDPEVASIDATIHLD
ncbi:P-loop containing nucleoside triphosphate hydrolase protein [Sesbania bispinosa]|nr:P-loop containing nucleoside triphosphate hydrolase protein [Sesbania bispinosa]